MCVCARTTLVKRLSLVSARISRSSSHVDIENPACSRTNQSELRLYAPPAAAASTLCRSPSFGPDVAFDFLSLALRERVCVCVCYVCVRVYITDTP